MITRFKIFEHYNSPPKEGDYVLIDPDLYINLPSYENFKNIVRNNIGRISKISNSPTNINIKFDNKDLSNLNVYSVFNIKYWSENKEDLEIFINTEKYNL